MEIKVTYIGLEDRQQKVAVNNTLGYRMLHDDFDDSNWKRGDPIVGTMTFTNVMPPEPKVVPDPPDVVTLKAYLSNPRSGLPDLETAFQALVRLYLGVR